MNSQLGEDSPANESHDELTRQFGDRITKQVFRADLEDVVIDDLDRGIPSEPRRFTDLNPPYRDRPPWLLWLVLPDIGGGRMTEKDLAVIGEHPDALALTISGLDQTIFESLITQYRRQLLAIDFFKCPRISDLSLWKTSPTCGWSTSSGTSTPPGYGICPATTTSPACGSGTSRSYATCEIWCPALRSKSWTLATKSGAHRSSSPWRRSLHSTGSGPRRLMPNGLKTAG